MSHSLPCCWRLTQGKRSLWMMALVGSALALVGQQVRAEEQKSPAKSDPKVEAILQLLPPQTSVVIVAPKLAEGVKLVKDSEFKRRLDETEVVKQWRRSRPYLKLNQGQVIFHTVVGVSVEDFVADYGQLPMAVAVLALDDGADRHRPDPGVAIFLHGKSEEDIRELLERLANGISNGDAEGRAVGKAFAWDVETNNGEMVYLATQGTVGFFTNEAEVSKALLEQANSAERSAASKIFQEIHERLPKGSALQLYADPHVRDDKVIAKLEREFHKLPIVREKWIEAWKGLNWMAASIELTPRPQMNVYFDVSKSNMAIIDDHFPVAKPAEESLWASLPANALAAGVGTIDLGKIVPPLLKLAESQKPLPNDVREVREVVNKLLAEYSDIDLLEHIGPAYGVVVLPTDRLLPNIAGMIELRDTDPTEPGHVPLSQVLGSTAHSVLVLLEVGMRQKDPHAPSQQFMITPNGLRISYFTGLPVQPEWLQPALAVTTKAVLFGTSPGAIEAVSPRSTPAGTESSETSDSLATWLADQFPSEQYSRFEPVLFVNLNGLRKVVDRHQGELVKVAAMRKPRAQEKIEASLRSVVEMAELADAVVVGLDRDGSLLRWSATIIPAAEKK